MVALYNTFFLKVLPDKVLPLVASLALLITLRMLTILTG